MGLCVDEFKPRKIEFKQSQNSANSAQDLLKLLENGELEVDHTIFEEDIVYTPGKKYACLLGGVFLMGTILGLVPGYLLIRYIVKLGPIWETTQTISRTLYLSFNHSILRYECINDQFANVKLTRLDKKSHVFIGSLSTGEHGSKEEFCLSLGGSEWMELWSIGNLKSNYQNVKEFCEISGVGLKISDYNREKFDLF